MELYVSVTKASSPVCCPGLRLRVSTIHHSPDAGCFAITIKNTAAGRRHWGATLLQLELELEESGVELEPHILARK